MSNRLLSKPIRQSPVQESFSPNTSKKSFTSFITNLMLRSNDEETDEIGKLQKDNDMLKRENLQLIKELSKYKKDYQKTNIELKSLEKSAEGLCDCDYYDYVTNSYDHIINEYYKSIEKTQQCEKLVKGLLKDIIQTNEHLEILINRNQILENTCKNLNIHVPTKGMEELDKLVEELKQSIDTSNE